MTDQLSVSSSASVSTLNRKIQNVNDLKQWMNSPGYQDLTSFIRQLNRFATGQHNGFSDLNLIKDSKLVALKSLLGTLNEKTNEIGPYKEDKDQRFGNKAYRVWFDEMRSQLDNYFKLFSEENASELRPYLEDSFGNKQRIDYGTGHELNFIIFLLGLYKLEFKEESTVEANAKAISHQFLTIFGFIYLPLCRKIQLTYRLEPAGSHGVYSLDDFQYLPFLFGSAELIGHPMLEPKNFPEEKVALANSDQYMWHSAIHFIFKVKNGPFFEHSNQLWNISGVDEWSKINRGLYKKYCDEVLHKFPIVQHIVFGEKVLKWQ